MSGTARVVGTALLARAARGLSLAVGSKALGVGAAIYVFTKRR